MRRARWKGETLKIGMAHGWDRQNVLGHWRKINKVKVANDIDEYAVESCRNGRQIKSRSALDAQTSFDFPLT